MHYSRIMSPPGDHRYFTSTAVFLNEVIKLAICMTFAIYEVSRSLAPQTPATVMFEQIYNSVFSGDGWKLAIPGFLYTLENTLQYVALSNLDAVHFQIMYQLKVMPPRPARQIFWLARRALIRNRSSRQLFSACSSSDARWASGDGCRSSY